MKKPRILIIEGNTDTREFLEKILDPEFEIITAENGVIGIDYVRNKNPDLILLEAILPVLNGYDTCSIIKKDHKINKIPIIFLSAKNTSSDISLCLSLGADDYISKPFDSHELLVRIKNKLKKNTEKNSEPISIGNLTLYLENRSIFFKSEQIQLTRTEFEILRCLATQSGKIISRSTITQEVWIKDYKKIKNRTIDVHIRAIRRKIPLLAQNICSIYGIGYKYEDLE